MRCLFIHLYSLKSIRRLDSDISAAARRNLRERVRVQNINAAFQVLEDMLPPMRRSERCRKPCKADILRYAAVYIERLQWLIAEGNRQANSDKTTPNSMNHTDKNRCAAPDCMRIYPPLSWTVSTAGAE
mgnify:CR=1 FL=1